MMPMISLAELQRRIDSGELSPDKAIAQSLEAIGVREKAIAAFVCRAENVRAANAGPLRGIAVGIKDIIDTADFPTEMGSAIYRGWQPRADAPVVMMLKQAGATIVGKTTTTAFAANDPTATLNPHHPGHTPGGSSSGSAGGPRSAAWRRSSRPIACCPRSASNVFPGRWIPSACSRRVSAIWPTGFQP